MSGKVLICLVGGQTIPNLVPLLHYHRQGKIIHALLVCSTSTTRQSRLTAQLLPSTLDVHELVLTDEYNVAANIEEIEAKIKELGWRTADLVFNVTGGTKTMMIAAYRLALRLSCEMNYYQTGKGGGSIHCYNVQAGELSTPTFEAPSNVLDIDTYFRSYNVNVSSHKLRSELQAELIVMTDPGNIKGHSFEIAVYDVVTEFVEELIASVYPSAVETSIIKSNKRAAAIELDLILRVGNNVALAEVKSGNKARERKGIDQLVIAGGQPYGAFTGKLFITDEATSEQNLDFIAAYNIEHCILSSYTDTGKISNADAEKLKNAIYKVLGV